MPRVIVAALLMLVIVEVPSGVPGERPLLAAQGDTPAGAGFIYGQVVDGLTRAPVAGARVFLDADGGLRPAMTEVLADAQGRFAFAGVPAGGFRVQATRQGWLTGVWGVDEPMTDRRDGAVVTVSHGARMQVTVPVWRPAIVSGRVTDEDGNPLADAQVSALQWGLSTGRRRLGGSSSARTDDRGFYTMTVRPGEYLLSASSDQARVVGTAVRPAGRTFVFQRTFYPASATPAGAPFMAFASGDDRSGVDFRLPLMPAVRVTGVLRRADAAGPMPARIVLEVQNEFGGDYTSRVDAQGRFVFASIPAGRYLLHTPRPAFPATPPAPNREPWARAFIDIGDADLDVTLDLRRNLLVSGRVQFDGAAPLPADRSLSAMVTVRPDDDPGGDVVPPSVPADSSGRFTLEMPPGRYIVTAGVGREIRTREQLLAPAPPGSAEVARAWSLRSAMHRGRDVADAPLDVTGDVTDLLLTFTDAPTVLRGRVTSRQGAIVPAQVFVFPADETLWVDYGTGRRYRQAAIEREATFELTNLPAGDYLVTAVSGRFRGGGMINTGGLPTPTWRALASRATRVHLREGGVHVENLELVERPDWDAADAPPRAPFLVADAIDIRMTPPPSPQDGATISGRVLDEEPGIGLASARVGTTPLGPWTYTDADGRFMLTGLSAGKSTLYVEKPGYVSTVFGARRTGEAGTPVTLDTGQHVNDLVVPLSRGATISGAVLDQHGEPVPGVSIQLRQYRWQPRGRELVVSSAPGRIPLISSDVRGQFRASGIFPGEYVVIARPPFPSVIPLTIQADYDAASDARASGVTAARRDVMHVPLFYPNAIDPAAAETVRLAAGDERTLNFQFQLVPTATVSGVVRAPEALPATTSVRLTPADQPDGAGTPARFGSADASGAFAMSGVAPGRYRVTASIGTTLSGVAEVLVNGDLSGVALDLAPVAIATVSGIVRGDSDEAAAQVRGRRLQLSPLDAGQPDTANRQAGIDEQGRFMFTNVRTGRYRLELTGGAAAIRPRVSSQTVDGEETIERGLEVRGDETIVVDAAVTLSESRLSILVRDVDGRPATTPTILLFARDPSAWTPPSRRVFAARADQNGRSLFPDVPPGEYLVAIVADIETGAWFNPQVLAALAGDATPITVRTGDNPEIAATVR